MGELKASVVRANLAGTVGNTTINANDAQQLALGYVHNLSKRPALYGTYSRISNDGIATFAVPWGAAAPVAGKTSTGYEVGIRHTF
jgi:predicted porin